MFFYEPGYSATINLTLRRTLVLLDLSSALFSQPYIHCTVLCSGQYKYRSSANSKACEDEIGRSPYPLHNLCMGFAMTAHLL
jgi:hypothetical protein